MKLEPLVEYSNWCSIDRVGDVDVEPGIYTIEWPDGSTTVEDVLVERASVNLVGEDGFPIKSPVSKAWIKMKYRGSEVKIYLRRANVKMAKGQRDQV